MNGFSPGTWDGIAALGNGAAFAAGAIVAGWLYLRRARYGQAGAALVAATGLTALWSLATLVLGVGAPFSALCEAASDFAWVFALYRLFASDGRDDTVKPVRPVVLALALAVLFQPAAQLAIADIRPAALLNLLVASGGLVLVHNLYSGASNIARLALRWPASALMALWLFDLNAYTIAYLAAEPPELLLGLRGFVSTLAVVLIAAGARRGSEELEFRPSRAATFQLASLVLILAYIVGMVVVAQWLALAGGSRAQLVQLGFVVVAGIAAIAIFPSPRLRRWLRVTLTKHLFKHRYDYREEWLRFTQTIGQGGTSTRSLQERTIQAVADITDSPAGLLLTPGEDGELELAARWQWKTIEVPGTPLSQRLAPLLERDSYIVDLDRWRSGADEALSDDAMPDWLRDEPRCWAMVPLRHFDRLVGLVVLARPPLARSLDWEDFDLLRIAGQQLASYLAEHASQEALAESGRFDDFSRRIAFVMHDIKNLASQMSLLARNAELHAENPEFRSDMLVTLRNSAEKLNALLARLSRYGATPVEGLQPISAGAVVQAVAEHFKAGDRLVVTVEAPCELIARREPLEQALVHLVQNALDASSDEGVVSLRVASDGPYGVIEVMDSGKGMSPEFVRSKLFKPFVSSKQGGFGIGAYEARELVRALGGRLDVESREGLGSRFTIRLPLAAAGDLIKSLQNRNKKVA